MNFYDNLSSQAPIELLVEAPGKIPILRATIFCWTLLFASTAPIQAQTATAALDLTAAPVVDSQEVDLGTRSIIYNRITQPKLKAPAEPSSPTTGFTASVPLTAAELAEAQRMESLPSRTLFLCCTAVKGTGLTELRWRDQNQEVVAWSRLDFSRLPIVLDFSSDTANYSLMVMVQEITPAEVEVGNAEVRGRGLPDNLLISVPQLAPDATALPAKSVYQFAALSQISDEVRNTMADLHHYADTQREQLELQYQEREADRLAREKSLRDNPPQPQDTEIRYFPIHNQPAPAANQEVP